VQCKTVIIVDDDAAVRDSLQALLETSGYLTQSYGSGTEFLKARNGRNDACVLLDHWMPVMNGLQVLQALQPVQGVPPIILITGTGDVETALQAMRSGAIGFLEKPVHADELFKNVDEALAMAGNPDYRNAVSEAARQSLDKLTQREREVLDLLVRGNSNVAIAQALGHSLQTAEMYRARIIEKTGVRSLPKLLRLATLAGVRIAE
jgi:two-component system response regulator FixJ